MCASDAFWFNGLSSLGYTRALSIPAFVMSQDQGMRSSLSLDGGVEHLLEVKKEGSEKRERLQAEIKAGRFGTKPLSCHQALEAELKRRKSSEARLF